MAWRLALLLVLLPSWVWAQASIVTSSGDVTVSGTTHTPTMPTGIASGNLLVAILAPNDPITALSTPTGYTKLTPCSSYNEIGVGVEVFYRHATGDANDNITTTSTGTGTVAYTIRRITGHLAATAPECSPVTTGTSTAPNPGAFSPSGGSAAYLWIAAAVFDTTPVPSCSLLANSSGSSTTDAASFVTNSVTLTAGRFYTLYVASQFATTPNTPTATSTGATWVAVADNVTNNNELKLSALRTMVAATMTGTVTIDFAAQTQESAIWAIEECAGTDVSGTNGSGAVVASNENASAGPQSSLTLTFAAFGSANNRPLVGFGMIAGTVTAWSMDWTQLSEVAVTAPFTMMSTGWLDSAADTTAVETTTGSASRIVGIGVEVKGLTGNATVSTYPTNYVTDQRNDGGAGGTRVATATDTTTAASEDVGAFALDLAETWYAFTIAVQPTGTASTPCPGFATVTGNSWSQSGGLCTPVNGFSVIRWDTASGPDQQALWTISAIPNEGETLHVAFRIEDASNRYRCVAERVAGADNDTITLMRLADGVLSVLSGPVVLGVDIAIGDQIGVDVDTNAISCIYRSVDTDWINTICAGGGDYCIVLTGTATTTPDSSYIGMGAAPPASATLFAGTLSAEGDPIDAPSVPTNCSALAMSSAIVQTTCFPSTGLVDNYEERWCTGVGCTPVELLRTTPATVYIKDGLSPETTYRFDRRACGPGGCSAYTPIYGTTTPPDPTPGPDGPGSTDYYYQTSTKEIAHVVEA